MKNYDLSKKLTLGLTYDYKKEAKFIFKFLIIISVILFLIGIILNELGFAILSVMALLCGIYFRLSINIKTIINKNSITKYNLFNKSKTIGSIDEITTFTGFNSKVFVYKNNKKMFSFPYKVGKDNKNFYNYLLTEHNAVIPIYKDKPVYLVYF